MKFIQPVLPLTLPTLVTLQTIDDLGLSSFVDYSTCLENAVSTDQSMGLRRSSRPKSIRTPGKSMFSNK